LTSSNSGFSVGDSSGHFEINAEASVVSSEKRNQGNLLGGIDKKTVRRESIEPTKRVLLMFPFQ
jgi:hypothetical protein